MGLLPPYFAIALFCLCVATAQAQSAGGLRGTVTDSAGHPIAGAAVTLRGPRDYSATTDATGAFTLADAEPGTYVVRASKA